MKTLILASQSPRRFEILKKENFFFVPFPVYVSEIPDKNLSLNEQIIDIASRKANACLDQHRAVKITLDQEPVILSADTMVCIDHKALGKPESDLEAFETLKNLSGRVHQVKTAFCLIDVISKKTVSHIETTDVYFKKLSEQQIHDYIKTGEHRDKAGSYGIQGQAQEFVEKFVGDYNNVVGLPIDAIKKYFEILGWSIRHAL